MGGHAQKFSLRVRFFFFFVFGFLTGKKNWGVAVLWQMWLLRRKKAVTVGEDCAGGCISTPTHTKHALNENSISLYFPSC
jgi:hypothetical protein